MIKDKLFWVIVALFSILLFFVIKDVLGANWQINPNDCPVEYNDVSCTGDELQCGINTAPDPDNPYCYDPSLLSVIAGNTSTYSTNNDESDDAGGYDVNCEATDGSEPYCDNTGNFWCERNETFHGSPMYRNTVCVGTDADGDFGVAYRGICKTEGTDMFNCYGDSNCESTSTSDCDGVGGKNNNYNEVTCETDIFTGGSGDCVCDSGYRDCEFGGNATGDGCETRLGVTSCDTPSDNRQNNKPTCETCACDSGWDDCNAAGINVTDGCEYEDNKVCAANAKNLTSCAGCTCDSGSSDCDSDILAGLGGTGCEVQDFVTACTVGPVAGTYDDSCTCLVDNQDIATTGIPVNWSGTNPMLWFNFFANSFTVWINHSNGNIFSVNGTGVFSNAFYEGGLALGNIYCKLTGCNITGVIDMNDNNIINVDEVIAKRVRFINGDNESYIKVGDDKWIDTANSIVYGNNDPSLTEGTITNLWYAQENKTSMWTQFGKNNSYGGFGNSLGVVPNYMGLDNFSDGGKVNMTRLSNYNTVCDTFGFDCKFNADTSGGAREGPSGIIIPGGPLLWTMGDLEVWGESKIHEGLELEKDFLFIGDGEGDIDLYNEPLHLKIPRLENVTFGIGSVELFEITWSGEATGQQPPPPFIETEDGVGSSSEEWSTRNDARCNDNPCARAKGGSSGATRGMDYNFSTLNVSAMELSFWYGSDNMDNGPDDNFSVFMNNNSGDGWVMIWNDTVTDSDINPPIFKEFDVPISMENKTVVSLKFNHYSTGNNEESFVDNVKINGTAGTPVIIEVTRNDARIEMGGSTYTNARCDLFYNDSTFTLEIGKNELCNVVVYNSSFEGTIIGTVNVSEFWNTNEGLKDNVIDILGSEITNDLEWIGVNNDSWVFGIANNGTFQYNISAFNCSPGTVMNSYADGTFGCEVDATGSGGGTTPHDLNASGNHTGNLSAVRVVKDTGTNYLTQLIDAIIDILFDRDASIEQGILDNVSGRPHNGSNADFDNLTANTVDGNLSWAYLLNYPSACPAGSAITELGDSSTCSTFATDDTTGGWINSTTQTNTSLEVIIKNNVSIFTNTSNGIVIEDFNGSHSIMRGTGSVGGILFVK